MNGENEIIEATDAKKGQKKKIITAFAVTGAPSVANTSIVTLSVLAATLVSYFTLRI
jgi:hypothetical protein